MKYIIKKTKRCDMICEEKLIYNINKDICKCEIGTYYIEETSKCYLMCKKGEKYIEETNSCESICEKGEKYNEIRNECQSICNER